MKTPALTIAFALALCLAPAFTIHADSPAADTEVSAPAYLQPWDASALQAFLTVGTKLEWKQDTGRAVLGQSIIKHPTIEVIAASKDGVTLLCTTQVAWEDAAGFELDPVSWEEELGWDEVAQRLCPHLPMLDAAGKPARVELELDGTVRSADFYVVERADGSDRFWFSVDRPGLLLKFEREVQCSVRIDGEDVIFRRVAERYTALDVDASAMVLSLPK